MYFHCSPSILIQMLVILRQLCFALHFKWRRRSLTHVHMGVNRKSEHGVAADSQTYVTRYRCSHERFDRFIDGLGVAGLVRVDWPDAPAPDDDPILVTDFDDLVPDAAYETFPDLPSSSS